MQLQVSDERRVAIRRVHAIVNPASGSVEPGAATALAAQFADLGLDYRITSLSPETAGETVRAAVDDAPDLVVVLGGDGTARRVAEIAGPEGPLVAPLSGGTMNKLSRALYGPRSWQDALRLCLEQGEERWVEGGEVGGRAFYCGAVLGSLALLAQAREAIRSHEIGRAWRKAVIATRKTLRSRISYELNGRLGRGVAVSFICPAVSSDPDRSRGALKAGVLEPPETDAGATAGLRLLLSNLVGDWREDADVTVACLRAQAWARRPIPVMLDGEFFRLGRKAEIRFRPRAFRALAPPER